MNHFLKSTLLVCLAIGLFNACGNNTAAEKETAAAKEAPAKTEMPASQETAVAKEAMETKAPEKEYIENKPQKSALPTKTRVDSEGGKGRTYSQSLGDKAQGNWRSNDNPNKMWTISGNEIMHLQESKLIETMTVEFYIECPNDCKGSDELERGANCMRITNKQGTECYILMEIDLVKMRYRKAGSNKVYSFRRLN